MSTATLDEFDLDIRLGAFDPSIAPDAATVFPVTRVGSNEFCCTDRCCTVENC